jgi:hypothetical protein
MKKLSQRTLVRVMDALGATHRGSELMYKFLYEHDFPEWFVTVARVHYGFDWEQILVSLRNARFFYPGDFAHENANVTGKYLSHEDALELGEVLIEHLAALSVTLGGQLSEAVVNSLQLDGYQVDRQTLQLVPSEGPVSAQAEEDLVDTLLRLAGVANSATIRQHISDANGLFVQAKYHPSLNESRNILQALIDDISTETDRQGGHEAKLPGGTVNRIRYLSDVGFLTPDEKAAFESAWGALSAGSHPGVPEREEARIGLILALEFSQLLLLKCTNWRKNAYKKF